MSLTDEEAEKLLSKLNVPENGFVLVDMYVEEFD